MTLEILSDPTAVRTGVTNGAGRLLFVGVRPDCCRIRVTSLAYGTTVTEPFTVESGARSDLGTVALTIEALELEALDVTAERSAVTFEADGTSYDVTAMASAQGAATADLLRNMPGLNVDLDGQISMNGSPTEVYIDERRRMGRDHDRRRERRLDPSTREPHVGGTLRRITHRVAPAREHAQRLRAGERRPYRP